MPKNQTEWVQLTDAAALLRLPYHRTLDLMLTGKLEGRRNECGRWVLARDSIDRFVKEQGGSVLIT